LYHRKGYGKVIKARRVGGGKGDEVERSEEKGNARSPGVPRKRTRPNLPSAHPERVSGSRERSPGDYAIRRGWVLLELVPGPKLTGKRFLIVR